MHTLWLLFVTFLKIGTFTFGGGYAMIPLIAQAITPVSYTHLRSSASVKKCVYKLHRKRWSFFMKKAF